MKVVFKGRVQGVGFRFTARQLAALHGLRGFVRNEPDGSVLLMLQGRRDSVRDMLSDLKKRMSGYIESTDYNELPADADYDGFEVRF
ncbi:MAG: acylphosphatase [Planctomycetota bacterium]|nr:acylphosphatase [Planctomycetota bacterium]